MRAQLEYYMSCHTSPQGWADKQHVFKKPTLDQVSILKTSKTLHYCPIVTQKAGLSFTIKLGRDAVFIQFTSLLAQEFLLQHPHPRSTQKITCCCRRMFRCKVLFSYLTIQENSTLEDARDLRLSPLGKSSQQPIIIGLISSMF